MQPAHGAGRPRIHRRRLACMALLALAACMTVGASPYVPTDDNAVLGRLSAGTTHTSLAVRQQADARLDVALPLAQFYITQARASGDLRFLGYAEAVLQRWIRQSPPQPQALVLHATILQSRHSFDAALGELDQALRARPDDAQAWLTRATVLRVRGRYSEAAVACAQFARRADPGVSLICEQSVRGLAGHLESAYATLAGLSTQGMLDPERAWCDSELGEMAVRLGRDADAERWFRQALTLSPNDFYVKAAYADLLLRAHRSAEVLELLKGQESIEPLLLRLAIAQKQQQDPGLARSGELLQAAFAAEAARGEPVHLREQARFLLEVQNRPPAALAAALADWAVQREPDDALILVDAARAAGAPQQAQPALEFARRQGLRDVRLPAAAGGPS
ncbi:MAG TPA: tetratricopeptide repeat protein [Steroidobacteraceae bacterium]|nr:tetratricopeptide repeat protein [Steroidobacteraceae bacterium]